MEPKINNTNVRAADFREKLQEVKKDNKDNLVSVDKDTGNVTIYTFDEKIPSDFKQGLAKTQIVFEDSGADDAKTEDTEINKFIFEVQKAGSKFDPAESFNQIRNMIPPFTIDLNEKVNNENIKDNIKNQLDKFSEALDKSDIPNIDKWSKILTNTVKQIAFDQFFVPDYNGAGGSFMSLGHSEFKLAESLRQITGYTDVILNKVKEDEIKTGIKE
jgi:hypothetical protein